MSPKKAGVAAVKKEVEDDDGLSEYLSNYDDNVLNRAVAMLNERESTGTKPSRGGDSFKKTKETVNVVSIVRFSTKSPRYGSKLSPEMLLGLIASSDGKVSDPHAKVYVDSAKNNNDILTIVPHSYAWDRILRDTVSKEPHISLTKETKDELIGNLIKLYGNNYTNASCIAAYHVAITSDTCAYEYSYIPKPIRMMLIDTIDVRMLKSHPRKTLIKRLLMDLDTEIFAEMFAWLQCPDLGMTDVEVRSTCFVDT